MPSRSPTASSIVATTILAFFAMMLLTGCSEKEMACERAVKAALGDPESYKAIDIKQDGETGKALELYVVQFSYYKKKIINGKIMCSYDNNDHSTSIHNYI